MKRKIGESAVSEILGAVLLIAIAVSAFSLIYLQVLSDDGPSPEIYVTLVGKLETRDGIPNTVAFENRRGETLGSDTEIILTFRGQYGNHTSTTVKALSSVYPFLLDGWNIGEKLYPPLDPTRSYDDQIDATIIDKKSNSIVFWGRLQEGYVEPPFGRGGIWHFDEPSWNGILGEVKDSSGNNNNGTAKNGASITADAKNGNAGDFTKFNDFVEVPNSPSLNIRDVITVEAWIKPQEESPFLDYLTLDQKFGYTPYIIHISGNIYAVVSEDTQKDGILSIVNISDQGDIEITNNKAYFGKSSAARLLRPVIHKVMDDLYVIAYSGGAGNPKLHLITFYIFPDGSISSYKHEEIFTDSDSKPKNRVSIISISDNYIAILYRLENEQGILRTIYIDPSDGSINPIDYEIFNDDSKCYEPDMIKMINNIYVISYRGHDNDGIIKTISISDEGEINIQHDKETLKETNCFEPHIINISNLSQNSFAIAYRNSDGQGFIETYNISNIGLLDYTEKLNFETEACYDPWIIKSNENLFLIVYSTKSELGASIGYYQGIEIFSNGKFGDIIVPRLNFEDEKCFNPIVIKIVDRIFAITYTGQGNHPGNLITRLIGDDPTPIWKRGIVKSGSASLYADTSKVYGCINNPENMISLNITPNEWNHVVLTFDGHIIKLYCNINSQTNLNSPDDNYEEKPYKGMINSNPNVLYFGYHYCGLLDEVGIFNRVLSKEEILHHQDCIGCYEVN